MAIDKDYLEMLAECSENTYEDSSYQFIMPKIIMAINKISSIHPEIDIKNTLIYKQGAYVNNTYVHDNTRLELVVEITRPSNIIALELDRLTPTFKKPTDEMKAVYTLPEFKNDLHIELSNLTKIPHILKSNRTISIPKSFKNDIGIEILPAYRAEENATGTNLLIFDSYSNTYLITYPVTHTENMEEKDRLTNGMFKKVVRITRRLKNILIDNQVIDEFFAPGYFIDCLLYNIPNSLFVGSLEDVYLKIINYLKNTNLANFVCAHENFDMFGNGIDGWDYAKARKFIDLLIYTWRNLEIE